MAKKALYRSFFAAAAFTLIAACVPMPKADDGVAIPTKVLLLLAAAGTTAYARMQVDDARAESAHEFVSKTAALTAHAETATVVAKVQAEQKAEQAFLQAMPQQPLALPQSPQTISTQANPSITVNVPNENKQQTTASIPVQTDGSPSSTKKGDGTRDNPRQDWPTLIEELFSARNNDDTYLYPCIFLTGRQGSGKTTFLRYIQQFLDGEVVVIDSHYKKGNWQGCKVVGQGKNYNQIERYLESVLTDTERRYSQYANLENPKFKPVTIIAEEMTNWDGEMEDEKLAAHFMKCSLSDFRKIKYRLISVAHADTNTARGGAKGTAKMRENGEVRIELVQKGLALVSMPGQPDFYLQFPNLEDHIKPSTNSQQKDEPKPQQVLTLRLKNGIELAEAICQIYGCERNSTDFQRAKMEVMAAIS